MECVFVESPIYYDMSQSSIIEDARRLARELGVELWEYYNDRDMVNIDYFYDYKHMNRLGADKFSAKFANRIKESLLQ